MDDFVAIQCMFALSSRVRLSMFRLLMNAGPKGKTAQIITEEVKADPLTAPAQLKELVASGLLREFHSSSGVTYAVCMELVGELIEHMTGNCCDGHPEACGLLFKQFELSTMQKIP